MKAPKLIISCIGLLLGINDTVMAANPQITYLTRKNFTVGIKACSDTEAFVEKSNVINNFGVISGSIASMLPSGECAEHAFLWGQNEILQVVPLLTLTDNSVIANTISSISSNNYTTGINFVETVQDKYELGALNLGLYPHTALLTENYPQQISENGKFVTGFNLGGQIFIYSVDEEKMATNFKINGKELPAATLVSIDNSGLAVGRIEDDAVNDFAPLICDYTKEQCAKLQFDHQQFTSCFLSGISAKGKYIMGHCLTAINPSLVKFDLQRRQLILIPNTTGFHSPMNLTDDGVTVISDQQQNKFLYDYSTQQVFTLADLVQKLRLPSNINAAKVSLSPNGKYAVFDSINYSTKNYAARVFFPKGIKQYLMDSFNSN
jgi:hypothetical protein